MLPPAGNGRREPQTETPKNEGVKIMYRKQMMLQRLLCILMIVVSAVVFVYALGYMTDANDMIATAALGYETNQDELDEIKQDIALKKAPLRPYLEAMNSFDRDFVRISIGLIVASLILLLTNTHTRRKYYISNYLAILVNVCGAVLASVWAHHRIVPLKNFYFHSGKIDFDYIKMTCDHLVEGRDVNAASVYTESAFWFDAHYYVFALLLLMAALLILNTIWKSILMKRERDALANGKAVN